MKNKLMSAALSLLIAFGLWMYVITEVSPGSEWTYYDIPVKMEGETVLKERNLIITDMSSTDVDLTLSGNRSDLNELNSSNITLKADMTKIYDPGTHKIGYDITFPVVYDTEYADNARANGLSNAERTACAKAFCDTVLAAGYTPVIYAGTNWSILDMNMEELQGYDLWYAYYGEAKDIYYPYNFTMWQYTDKGKVDGIPTDADLNISFVDYSTR